MSSSVIQVLRKHFLQGGFVNADANPDWFEFLNDDPANIDLVNEFLGGIGVKIIHTTNGRTWYPIYQRLDEATRKEIEKTAVDHKKVFRHVISFFRLTIGATSHGQVPQGGAVLRVSTMSEIIHNNSNLVDRLKVLCARVGASAGGGDSIHSMINAVIRWAERNDLLVEINSVHGEFRFTGKVDWINDMNASFDECVDVPLEVDTPENLPLF